MDFWWSHDDAHHLLFALEHQSFDYLFNVDTYRKFHDTHLAPWNILSYDINLNLFGVNPIGFFAHQIVSACLLAFSMFFLLRLWVPALWAVGGTLLFIISPPTTIIVSQLMNVHYLEGLIFTCTSTICFVLAVRRNSIILSLAGALLYFLATASKEIFVPLVAILIFLPIFNIHDRVRIIVPYVLVACFYIVWHSYFISDSLSSWVDFISAKDYLLHPIRLTTYVFGLETIGLFASVITFFFIAVLYFAYPKTRLFCGILVICLLVPLIPVSNVIGPARFHCFIAFCLCCALAIGAHHFFNDSHRKKYLVFLLPLIVFPIMFVQSANVISNAVANNNHHAIVGKFVLDHDENVSLFTPTNMWKSLEIEKLKKLLNLGQGPQVFMDVHQLEQSYPSLNSYYLYDIKNKQIKDISNRTQKVIATWKDKILNRSLSISLTKTERGVFWNFGPHRYGNYSVILLSRNLAFAGVKSRGLYRANLPAMRFILRYISPQGWVTYSAPLEWKNQMGENLVWARI